MFTILDSSIQLTLSFIDHADLLVAFCLHVLILCSLSYVKTLFEELQGHIEIVHLQLLVSNELINSHKVFRDNARNVNKLTIVCFIKSRLQMLHSRVFVKNFFFANTKTSMRLGFSLDILEVYRNIEASLMEVRSRFVIVVAFVHDSHFLVSSETVACCLISPVKFALFERLTDLGQLFRCVI